MAEKHLNTRIIHKHDIEANWLKAINFIPKLGELIIYDIDENHPVPRMKLGDGETTVNELYFVSDNIYKQPNEPENAPEGALWVDMDEEFDETILPEVTVDDDGQFLRVVNGKWAAATVPNAEEASF